MNEVSWLGFGISSTVTKTFVHFLPAAAGIGAPYPVDMKITVGGSSLPRRTLSVEGARLGHPDGFRIEEAIPALNQQVSGLYLLLIELAPAQQRIDLTNSCVLIEVQYQQAAVRYLPRRIPPQISDKKAGISEDRVTKTALKRQSEDSNQAISSIMARGIFNPYAKNSTAFALRDPTLFASLVVLNSSSENIVARICSSRQNEAVGSVSVPPDSVIESDITDLGLSRPSKLDSTWGSLEVEAFTVFFERDASSFERETCSESTSELEDASPTQLFSSEPILGAAASAYVVYRDRSSRRISSVLAI